MKKTLLFAATALAMLASCSQSDDLNNAPVVAENNQAQPIEFGTYLGRTTTTRATATGNITSAQVLAQKNGFGVFAYYTGRNTYGQHQKVTYTAETPTVTNTVNHYPDFMYNQQVTGTNDETPTWSYSPVKYWPNDFADGTAVDTQSPAAYGSDSYGGNVSFFAYAPYVAKDALDSPVGITGMSANTDLGDPTVTYTITNGTVTSNTDLLWGTYSGTSQNVLDAGNTGVTANGSADDGTYAKAILTGYTTNADLNKQQLDGKVGFAFKHALAGLGGGSAVVSSSVSGVGFQVVLDVDEKVQSAKSREEFTVSSTNDAWRTIVTISNIEISNDLNADGDAEDDGEVALPLSGTLNLATGKWTDGTTGVVKQTIGNNNATDTYQAEISSKIAEYWKNTGNSNAKETWISKYATKTDYFKKTLTAVNTGDHPGVTETPQNVYNDETQSPLMFIPGKAPVLRITVEYVVRTYDAALASAKPYTEVTQKISKKVTFPTFALNKHYNLIMHLGLTGVKFTATVSNWDEETIGDSDGDSTNDNMVFLPINVD